MIVLSLISLLMRNHTWLLSQMKCSSMLSCYMLTKHFVMSIFAQTTTTNTTTTTTYNNSNIQISIILNLLEVY